MAVRPVSSADAFPGVVTSSPLEITVETRTISRVIKQPPESPATKRYLKLSERYPGYARQCPHWVNQFVAEYMKRLKPEQTNGVDLRTYQTKLAQGYAVYQMRKLLQEREEEE